MRGRTCFTTCWTINARAVTAYLNAQIEAGAQAVMVFDTWGGSLSTRGVSRVFARLHAAGVERAVLRSPRDDAFPSIVFTKGGGAWLEDIANTGADAVGLDWTVDLAAARARIGDRVALQGNLDPAALFAPPDALRREVNGDVLAAYGHGPGHVFNLGHGISQHTDPAHVGVLVDAVHELSRAYH